MYNWVVRRILERTSAPQAVYQSVVDAGVRVWMPAIALVAASVVTPARAKLDIRAYDWAPSFAWATPIATAAIAPTVAPAATEASSYRTPDRAKLDVRSYEWDAPESSWISGILAAPTTAQLWPAIVETHSSGRTADRLPGVDLRRYDWAPADDWMQTVAATVPVQVAPIASSVAGVRTAARASLDVRQYEWSSSIAGWNSVNLVTAPTAAQIWPAIVEASGTNYRTSSPVSRDVRYHDPSTLFGVPDDPATFDGAIFSDDGGRTVDRPRLDVRRYEWSNGLGWIYATLATPATTDQLWPAIAEGTGQNYRTLERARLDVRRYDWAPAFSWVAPVVDAQVSSWSSIFAAEATAFRTAARAPLDVRTFDWAPETAWFTNALPPVVTVAQAWPAIQQNLGTNYVTADRPRLEVRAHEWLPSFAWVHAAIDAQIASWVGVLSSQAASFRSADRARLDIRAYDWSPETGWLTRSADAVIAKWAPVWSAEFSYRTPDGQKLDIRSLTSHPQIGWFVAIVDFGAAPTADYIIRIPADDLVVRIPADDEVIQIPSDSVSVVIP